MNALYVLYDPELEVAYEVDLFSLHLVGEENIARAQQGKATRWIPLAHFMEVRSRCILVMEGKAIHKVTFPTRAGAEITAQKLGGYVQKLSMF